MPDNYLERAQEKYGPIDQKLLDDFEAALANLPAVIPPLKFDDPELDGASDVTKTVILSRALRYVARQLHIDFDHPDLIGKLLPQDTTPPNNGEESTGIVQSTMNMYQSFFSSMFALVNRFAQTAIVSMLEQQRVLGAAVLPDTLQAARQTSQPLARNMASQASSSTQSAQQPAGDHVASASDSTGNHPVSSGTQVWASGLARDSGKPLYNE